MQQIDAVEFQKRLPSYLKQVEDGEIIRISARGRVFARLAPEQNEAEAAQERLALMRGSVITGNVLDPIEDAHWNADADHL